NFCAGSHCMHPFDVKSDFIGPSSRIGEAFVGWVIESARCAQDLEVGGVQRRQSINCREKIGVILNRRRAKSVGDYDCFASSVQTSLVERGHVVCSLDFAWLVAAGR